jgi:hypothetical protein
MLLWILPGCFLVIAPAARAANFTTGSDLAVKFGVHEIALTGEGSVANPFDTRATVTFVPPSGQKNAKAVSAFYDGGNTWRARVYVSEDGAWSWSSACATDKRLDGKTGTFKSADSKLRGRLLPHPKNPRHWSTEDGRWFLHVGDTAYFLLSSYDEKGQQIPDADMAAYVRDAVDHGITSFLAYAVSGPGGCFDEDAQRWTDAYFADPGFARLRLDLFQCSDRRLRWLLEHYPDVSIQLILFPRGSPYKADDRFWSKLSVAQKERMLRQTIARYAAYPQLTWLVACDAHYGMGFPNNNAMAREVGAYFRKQDPWHHPMSTHHARFLDFQFADEAWATYIFLENGADLGASNYAKYHRFAKPVLLGEDRYEQYHPERDPMDMRYFQRRLYWAWLFSGGSANYGGRWWVLHPYTQSGKREASSPWKKGIPFKAPLTGLDSAKFIGDYFEKRTIALCDFEPDHGLARDRDGTVEARAPKLMRRGQEEFLVYHPNAADDGREAKPDAKRKARLRLDLRSAKGPFSVEWYRAADGFVHADGNIAGGREVELVSPWTGHDVVLRLVQTR